MYVIRTLEAEQQVAMARCIAESLRPARESGTRTKSEGSEDKYLVLEPLNHRKLERGVASGDGIYATCRANAPPGHRISVNFGSIAFCMAALKSGNGQPPSARGEAQA